MALHLNSLLTLVTVAALIAAEALADEVLADSELVLTVLVHRHGDRTPVQGSLELSNDVDALRKASEPYGYGQLTNVGKRTAYRLGQSIRKRYGSLISAHYNSSEIYIRSTDSTRAQMTVLTAMAAVYPAGDDNWSDSLPWQPTPYTMVPTKYDPNLAISNCPPVVKAFASKMSSTSAAMERYTDVLNQWSELIGTNITATPVLAYGYYDVYKSQNSMTRNNDRNLQISLGVPLTEELQALLPEIKEIAGAAMDVLFGDDDYVALEAGVYMNDVITAMTSAASGDVSQPLRIYSAHDTNVYPVMAAARITPRQGVPPYCSSFALELRKRTDTGDYVVLPVYQSSPDAELMYLQVEGCSALLCPLDEFVSITKPFVLDEDTWRQKCA
ncbi:prostatic acid phosphatase-like [Manduca sexta]|uniref:prostatic acid phosphatase-like n=1 Tax=Manduca sexta TaxID=7130 RepID=UPI00188E5763|nr:prostatic acid phosphatase-like [Manduca sexta]